MRIHLIAIGGAVMHNIALALQNNHHTITGSDDEIYNPSRQRLEAKGLLPHKMGWFPENITTDLDVVILGMHARPDNPELNRALELNLPVFSFPEYIFEHAKDKKRVVVAGSHGKTTTTSMIMHVLHSLNMDFDYLVGAQLEGFDTMVRFSDAPIMVIEGDEYLSSPIDRRPKFLHYKADIAIITGIAWDHINVFTTFDDYRKQFQLFIESLNDEAALIVYEKDAVLQEIIEATKSNPILYNGFEYENKKGKTFIKTPSGTAIEIAVFGKHNLQNLQAAYHACAELGVSDADFFEAIQSFKGAAKRLQKLAENEQSVVYQDFAHAPSKTRATVQAMKDWFPERTLLAYLELHTFSSLNKKFLTEYAETMNAADKAVVYFSQHTLAMKKLEPISKADILAHFQHPNMEVLSDEDDFISHVNANFQAGNNVLMMSSGTFGGTNLQQLATELIKPTKIIPNELMKEKKISESKTIMTEMIMPNDTNPLGNLMGGNLLRWMDIVGGICAGKHCEAHVVTVSVDHVSFQKPIRVGDVITLEARVTRAFNSSVEIYVEVFAANVKGHDNRRSNDAYFTFVGLDDDSLKPKAIPKVIPLTRDEQNLFESALRRRQLRLILSGRLKPEDATEIKSLFIEEA